jgi:predicted glycogen debranching enzyme
VEAAWRRRVDHERDLLRAAAGENPPAPAQLVLAADQFIVQRRTITADADVQDEQEEGTTVIAGYPWFSDWGRDTMVSLPGLVLSTGRAPLAARILRTYATFVDQGMLPNRFPDEGQTPEYNSVDASLWAFEALHVYLEHVSGDDDLCRDLFPVLQEIIDSYRRGTRHNIHRDEEDGLLYAGEEGLQLTWMDAKVDDWVVTPRIGKAVEVNALWFNALKVMGTVARAIDEDADPYETLAEEARQGFARFWNEERKACYDVLDGPQGADASLRPNQIFAVSLAHSPLPPWQQKAVVDVCTRRLVTSFGLRTLAPDEEGYVGRYEGDQKTRDGAYHQGTVWAWLMGPFVRAYLRVYGERDGACQEARRYLAPLMQHLADHGLGSVSEIFDGDAPFSPHGCTAQAWSVAALIRAWQGTA